MGGVASIPGVLFSLLVVGLLIGSVAAVVLLVLFVLSWRRTFAYLRKNDPERWQSLSWFSTGMPKPDIGKQERQMKFLFSAEDDPALGRLKRSLRIRLVLFIFAVAIDAGLVVVASLVAVAFLAVSTS